MRMNAFARYVMLFCISALVVPALALAAAPSQVTGLKVSPTADPTKASISWDAAKYATTYQIYRAEVGNSGWEKIATTGSRSYSIATAAEDARYQYKVRAYSTLYRKYGGFSAAISPQPADLADLVGDDATGMLEWSASAGAARYKISVVIGADEPLVRYTRDLTADFASLVPLFGDPGVEFEVVPVSAAGVEGLSAVYSQDSQAAGTSGQGPVVSTVAGPTPDTFVMVLHDTQTATDYTVLVDGESLLDRDDVGELTLPEFMAGLSEDPTRDVSFDMVDDPAKTDGTGADFYLSSGTIMVTGL